MLQKVKDWIGLKKKKQDLERAEGDFDELMQRVDDDEIDLSKLEGHMRAEWDDVHKEVESVRRGVDETVNEDKAA